MGRATVRREFGWLSQPALYITRHIRVEPLPSFQKSVDAVKSHDRAAGDWFYPPLIRDRSNRACQVYDVRFKLPCTHQLTLRRPFQSEEFAATTIALLGILNGVQLVPQGVGHFNRVPI